MNQIRKITEFIQKFDYIVKVAKAVLAGFDTFNDELNKSIKPIKNEKQ